MPASPVKKQSMPQASLLSKNSPSYRRIVNIYSVNNIYKKKKYVSNHSVVSNSSLSNQSAAYRGDDVKQRLQQLRENIAEDRAYSLERGVNHNNSSLQLPELKSITPTLNNVKHYYDQVNSGVHSVGNKAIGKKKSYERLVRLDQQLYHLYK